MLALAPLIDGVGAVAVPVPAGAPAGVPPGVYGGVPPVGVVPAGALPVVPVPPGVPVIAPEPLLELPDAPSITPTTSTRRFTSLFSSPMLPINL